MGAELPEPEPLDPEPLDPELPEPEPLELGALEPEPLELGALEPEPLELGALEPELLEPELLEPELLEPEPLAAELPEPVEVDEGIDVPELLFVLVLQPAIALASTAHITTPVALFGHHLLPPVIDLFNSIPRSCSLHAPAPPASHYTITCTYQQHQTRS